MKTHCRLIRSVLAAAFMLPVTAFAGPVLPGKPGALKEIQYQYTVDTVGPVKRQGALSAGGVSWQCGGTRCTATGPWPAPGVAACAALAQQVGAVKSYGHAQRSLNAAEIAQCNSAIPKASAAKDADNAQGKEALGAASPPRQTAPGTTSAPPATGFGTGKNTTPPPMQTGFAPPQKAPGAPAPGLRPPGMKGTQKDGFAGTAPTQSSGNGSGSSPASPATPAPSAGGFAPQTTGSTRPSGAVSFTTEALTLTGTGALTARLPFSPRVFTTEALTVTGAGALAPRAPFTPKTFATDELSVTGTGALR